ncbi:FecCD family ABC transporter permease [Microbacterium sp. TNHR37B]|uniref:FecCD family ABC transporter permease n=1 Tax=Microbacterium sp. TNHR37B TaxID=1775956 RepID=UPI0007B27C0F|nr:iron chelate uptake ABC transporter family permease subunit [Microbacterium sp. TNHR37B]KZE90560.1 Ferric enterobactin transport system permease protein FepG [Microbacterium sp. TNHR37B]
MNAPRPGSISRAKVKQGRAETASRVDFGEPMWRLRGGNLSTRIPLRRVRVSALLLTAAILCALVAMTLGASELSLGQVWGALSGSESAATERVVVQWRLPRVLFALLCGAALAYSGAVFQTLTRNPLGSPDVIGFATGSYLAVAYVTAVLGAQLYLAKAGAALVGGFLTALLVYALAFRNGVSSFRLIIVGIGVSAALSSLTSWILLSVSVEKAMVAATWGAGSIASLGFDQFWPALLTFTALLLLGLPLTRSLPMLELGDDLAAASGVRVARVRRHALLVGVGMIALVTAAAGPISFIALAAPQIAQRLTRAQTPMQPVTAMCTGALLVVLADALAVVWELPVGVVTVSVGGLYLVWLLAREYRTRG